MLKTETRRGSVAIVRRTNASMNDKPEEPFETLTQTQRVLLDALIRKAVRVILIGGYAVRVHGYLRPAEDLDFLIDCKEENLVRLRQALASVDADKLDLVVDHLTSGRPALVRWSDTEFFSSAGGITFDEAIFSAGLVGVHEWAVPVISKEQLIQAKRAAAQLKGRGAKVDQDVRDVAALTGNESLPSLDGVRICSSTGEPTCGRHFS